MLKSPSSQRSQPASIRRDAWVEVNLNALEHNTRQLLQCLPHGQHWMAVLKADGYGHGAKACIPILEALGASCIGVASMDEALQIRQAGLTVPVLVLGGVPDWSVPLALEHDIQLSVFTLRQLQSIQTAVEQAKSTARQAIKPIAVHIKVNTGMNRIGVPWQEAPAFHHACLTLEQQGVLDVRGIFSHLACAGNAHVDALQNERWQQVLNQLSPLPPFRHLLNSSGVLAFEREALAHTGNLVRFGIALFGFAKAVSQAEPLNLKPVMGLKARIVHLQEVPTGEGVSYNHQFVTQQPSRLATLPLGYADGVPRVLSGQIQALLKEKCLPQVGMITMDQLMVDVTACPEAALGDTVTLLGPEVPMNLSTWASAANTIEYELMCGLRVRLPRVVVRHPF
jgi:alanine racemase